LPERLVTGGGAVIDNGDAGRIVAAVLHATKPVDENGKRLIFAYVTDDSAHAIDYTLY